MQRERLWIVFGLAVVAMCILVYYLFFIAIIPYYYGLLIVFVLGLLFLAVSHKEELARNRRRVLGELGIIFGMCAIYTSVYVSVGIYQADFHILTAIAAFIGLFIGCVVSIIIQDIGRSMIYVCVSAVSAIAIAVTLIVLPPFLAGEYEMVNYALLPTIQLITLPAIFAIMFSLFGTALGYFIGDSLK